MADSNFSLIIPTRFRPGHVERLFRYFLRHSQRFPIILADGSEGNVHAEYCRVVNEAQRQGLNIDHFVSPELNYSNRVLAALRRVNTAHVNLTADDDFISPDFLIEASRRLHDNSSVAAPPLVEGKRPSLSAHFFREFDN